MHKGRQPTLRSALLRHETPPGSDVPTHRDWLIELTSGGDPDERALAAFRLGDGADPMTNDRFEGRAIRAHRRLYLTHEGPVGGGRGSVRRLWRVAAVVTGSVTSGSVCVELVTPSGPREVAGVLGDGDVWAFTAV